MQVPINLVSPENSDEETASKRRREKKLMTLSKARREKRKKKKKKGNSSMQMQVRIAIIRPLKINYSILIPARLNFYPPLQQNLFGSVLS